MMQSRDDGGGSSGARILPHYAARFAASSLQYLCLSVYVASTLSRVSHK